MIVNSQEVGMYNAKEINGVKPWDIIDGAGMGFAITAHSGEVLTQSQPG